VLSASRFVFVLYAALVQGRLDLILSVHFGAVSRNPALKERVRGCGLSGRDVSVCVLNRVPCQGDAILAEAVAFRHQCCRTCCQ
jgi:hypothetical protein